MIRESVRTVLQELVEFEAAGVIGADRYARTEDRVTERNGTRPPTQVPPTQVVLHLVDDRLVGGSARERPAPAPRRG